MSAIGLEMLRRRGHCILRASQTWGTDRPPPPITPGCQSVCTRLPRLIYTHRKEIRASVTLNLNIYIKYS